MIEVLTSDEWGGDFVLRGTIDVVRGKVKFNIKDKDLLETIRSAPPEVVNEGAEAYLSYICGRFALSSTIVLKKVKK